MLSKSNRINKTLFKEVFAKGISYNNELLYIKKFELKNKEEKRCSFVVSKSVSKLAVKRNLIKRRARHILRMNLDKIRGGNAVVFFFTKKEILNVSFKEFEEKILNILKKADLLN